MAQKIVIIICASLLLQVAGCQEEQKTPEATATPQAKEQVVVTPDQEDIRMQLMVNEQDILTARNPDGQQSRFLTVVDKDGKPKECCKQPMRVKIDKDGRLSLKCPKCNKIKPVAVKDGQLIVE